MKNTLDEMDDIELYDAFTELGSNPELSNVEFALEAQAEVAMDD